MYLRIRKLNPDDIKEGEHVVMVAKQLKGKAISMQPGQLEWWDGLDWHEVRIVEKDADKKSPYAP
jgi:hypothetical protein